MNRAMQPSVYTFYHPVASANVNAVNIGILLSVHVENILHVRNMVHELASHGN